MASLGKFMEAVDYGVYPHGLRGFCFILELKKALGARNISCILDDCSEAPWDQAEAGEVLRGSWPMPVNCWGSGRGVSRGL